MKILPALFLASAAAFPSWAFAQTIPGPQVGQAAPPIAARSFNGRAISLADYRGKVLVLNFWATWCPPCRAETPDMIESFRKLAGPDVAFLGLDSTEQTPIIRSFVAAKGLPYPLALDSDKKTVNAYDVRGIPTTFVIDGNGIVRARFVDVISMGQLASFVSAARAGRSAVITSAVQSKIDAMLDPAQFTYTPEHDGVLKTVKAMNDAIAASNQLLGQADPAKGETTDYLKMRAEQAALENTAVSALAKVANSDSDRSL